VKRKYGPLTKIQASAASLSPDAYLFVGVDIHPSVRWAIDLSRGDDGELYFGRTDGESPEPPGNIEDCLWGFCALTNAEPARLLKFAQQYQLLGFCEHRNPSAKPTESPWYLAADCPICKTKAAVNIMEPIAAWRACARHLSAVLSLTAFVRNPVVNSCRPEWSRDLCWGVLPDVPYDDPDILHAHLYGILNYWLKLVGVGQALRTYPVILPFGSEDIPESKPGVYRVLASNLGGLCSTLGLQLAAVLSSEKGIPVCKGCGCPLDPERRRLEKRRTCEPCGRLDQQQRSLKCRERKRELLGQPRQRRSKYSQSPTRS
jgi:hypothetical protein